MVLAAQPVAIHPSRMRHRRVESGKGGRAVMFVDGHRGASPNRVGVSACVYVMPGLTMICKGVREWNTALMLGLAVFVLGLRRAAVARVSLGSWAAQVKGFRRSFGLLPR